VCRLQLDRLPDHRNLARIDLEVDQFRRVRFPPREFLFHLPPEPPSAAFELCATRLHNRKADRPGARVSLAPVASSIPLPSDPSAPAAGARGWRSGSTPSFSIPGIAAPGTHQTTSDSPACSTVPPAPRGFLPVRQRIVDKGWYCKAQVRVVALFFAILAGCGAPRVGRRACDLLFLLWLPVRSVFLTLFVHLVASARNSDVAETRGRYLHGKPR
jgi:hypothetical protein